MSESPQRFDGPAFARGAFLGFIALWIVYLVVFFGAGAPYGRIGVGAYVPVALCTVAAVVVTVRPRTLSLGAGMLLGLGLWLLIGGGLCIAGLSQTPGLS
jgi:hypothetical protein